jgi:threonylcarbamoyladenosine tRNA methylthiotransferase MtaB
MYRRLVERLATAIPSLGLGADVIVGFPGERDADFAETLALIEALPFSYLHVFPYSTRRGTEAATFAGVVDERTIARRSMRLRELARAKSLAFRRGLAGSLQEVLVLETRDRATGRLTGLTGNYVEVLFEGADALMKGLARVRVTDAERDRTLGEIA